MLLSTVHKRRFSDGLFYQNSLGTLTYINMCGVTTTQCSPSSPVCQRTALWTTMGFGALNTQHMNKIGLFSSSLFFLPFSQTGCFTRGVLGCEQRRAA